MNERSDSQSRNAPVVFPAFNGLRFLAALAVVAFHYADPHRVLHARLPHVSNVIGAGATSLGFFFILSGFVLAHASRNRPVGSREGRRSFWLARFAKLYPVYLLAFLLFAPIAALKFLHLSHRPGTFFLAGVVNLFAVQAWTPLAMAWNGPSWSLSNEAFFYALFPFVFRPLMKAGKGFAISLCVVGWLLEISLVMAHATGQISDDRWHVWIQYNPLFWVPLFLTGICLYKGLKVWESLPGNLATGLSVLATLCLFTWASFALGYVGDLLEMGGAAPLFAVLIVSFVNPGNRLTPALSGRFLTAAGAASYALYILQAPLEHYFTRGTHTEDSHSVFTFPALCVFLVLASLAVNAWLEQPAKNWILKQVNRLRPALPQGR